MNHQPDLDFDRFEPIGAAAARVVHGLERDALWNGKTITTDGVYRGIRLADYHDRRDLLDGPSISKSALKWLLPAHGGSPKAFWGRWKWNPDHVPAKSSPAMDFGRAAHCLLLGDEVFEAAYAIRPDHFPDYRTAPARAWRDSQIAAGKTVITYEDRDRIERMRADASSYPLIRAGILNGRVERSMFWKDPETGIWLKARPDAIPEADGVFADLKTAGSFDEDFLERQIFDAAYYLQAAVMRMVCRGLGIPFETFTLVYVLNDDVPDTAHVEIHERDIDRGERAVRWCLQAIRRGLDTGEWPGARPFDDGTRHAQMKVWAKDRLDQFLDREDQLQKAA